MIDMQHDNDATASSDAGGDAETEFVETPTAAAQSIHAWELDEDDTAALAESRPWGDAWRHASVLVLGGVLVAMFALAVFVIGRGDQKSGPVHTGQSAAGTPAVAAPSPMPAPAPSVAPIIVPPAPAPAPPGVKSDDPPAWTLSTDNDPALARQVCTYMRASTDHHAGSAAIDIVQPATGWGFSRAFDFAGKAINESCPQYVDQ